MNERQGAQGKPSFDAVVGMMTESAQAFSAAIQTFMEAAAKTAAETGRVGQADPAAVLKSFAENWGRASSQLGSMVGAMLQRWLDDLPAAAQARLDAQTFAQLQRLARGHLEEELRRLSEVPAEILERAGKADPKRLGALMQSLVAEYLADLQSLKESAFQVDFGPLAQGLGKLLAGDLEPAALKVVQRFLDGLAVKARYGAEYYADPGATPVGQTPRELIHREGRFELFRYTPKGGPRAGRPPVLLVYSVINRPYILDLVPGFSFVEHLLAEGLDVYLIEWGETEPGDRATTLDSYIEPGIHGAVEHIRAATGAARVALFGHCIGGNLALLYAALHPERVARLVTLTTPGTAAEGGVVAVWTDRDIFPIDAIIDTYGHMPAKLIRYTFMALKPYYEVLKWKMFVENLGNEEAMRLFAPVDRWANENVDIPGEVFRKFVVEVLHEDRFRKGETVIHGRKARLRDVTCPLLNLAASRDWIVPPKSAQVINAAVGSAQNEFVLIEGAHVGIMIDPRSRPLWKRMSDFLKGRADTVPAKKKQPRASSRVRPGRGAGRTGQGKASRKSATRKTTRKAPARKK